MTDQDHKRPTDAELEILKKLWDLGPSTVRQLFHAINKERETGYTTVLKIMQIMIEKGLLKKDSSVRPQVYEAAQPKQKTQRQLVGHLLDRAFSGSPGSLVLQALSTQKTSPEEREMIRDLLNKLEEETK